MVLWKTLLLLIYLNTDVRSTTQDIKMWSNKRIFLVDFRSELTKLRTASKLTSSGLPHVAERKAELKK